ncbi:MAG TPA: sulfotransferase [Chthoniobacterales bacterium]
MHDEINKPVFVVGSPRSGTSILTWCLGQHPNMFPLPESNWMGDFVVNLAVSHQVGTARGERAVLSAMDIGRDEFFAQFGRSINQLILSHREDLNRKRKKPPSSEPKARWVDGTPEYSTHIFALRKLFPAALFIHIVRDVREVVRSMLNFHRVAGTRLVANEQAAYKYWLRTVTACVRAEHAYGPQVIRRFPYSALIDNGEAAMRSLLEFVGERYDARCVEPLRQRINSSNVPEDFVAEDPATNRAIVDQAVALYAQLMKEEPPAEPAPSAAAAMAAEFEQRVKYAADLDRAYRDCRRTVEKFERQKR